MKKIFALLSVVFSQAVFSQPVVTELKSPDSDYRYIEWEIDRTAHFAWAKADNGEAFLWDLKAKSLVKNLGKIEYAHFNNPKFAHTHEERPANFLSYKIKGEEKVQMLFLKDLSREWVLDDVSQSEDLSLPNGIRAEQPFDYFIEKYRNTETGYPEQRLWNAQKTQPVLTAIDPDKIEWSSSLDRILLLDLSFDVNDIEGISTFWKYYAVDEAGSRLIFQRPYNSNIQWNTNEQDPSFSVSGRFLVIPTASNKLGVNDSSTGEQLYEIVFPEVLEYFAREFVPVSGDLFSVRYDSQDSQDYGLYDAAQRKWIVPLQAGREHWQPSPNGRFAYFSNYEKLQIYNLGTGEVMIERPYLFWGAANFSPDSKTVSIYKSGLVEFFSTETSQSLFTVRIPDSEQAYEQVVYSPDSTTVVIWENGYEGSSGKGRFFELSSFREVFLPNEFNGEALYKELLSNSKVAGNVISEDGRKHPVVYNLFTQTKEYVGYPKADLWGIDPSDPLRLAYYYYPRNNEQAKVYVLDWSEE